MTGTARPGLPTTPSRPVALGRYAASALVGGTVLGLVLAAGVAVLRAVGA